MPATGSGSDTVKLSLISAIPPPPTTYGSTRLAIGDSSTRTFVVNTMARPSPADTVGPTTELSTAADPSESMIVADRNVAGSGLSAGTEVISTPKPTKRFTR